MQIALIAVVLALPVTLTLSTFELIERVAVRRLASAGSARGDGAGHQRGAKRPGGDSSGGRAATQGR